MAYSSRARAIAGGLLLLLGGMTSTSTLVGRIDGRSASPTMPTAETPLIVALAETPALDFTPGAAEADMPALAAHALPALPATAPAAIVADHASRESDSPALTRSTRHSSAHRPARTAERKTPDSRRHGNERTQIASLDRAAADTIAPNNVAPNNVAPDRPAAVRAAPVSAAWAPARFFTINQVLASRKAHADGASSVQLASLDPAATMTDAAPVAQPPRGDEPFGLFTFRAPEGLLWIKWRKVEADISAEAPVLSKCRAQAGDCTPAAARFNAIVDAARAQRGRARIALVNERINAAIRYTSDYVQHGVPDLWSAPLASLASGLGDCEDYAIAKYAALRAAGIADRDLHLLLVRDKAVRLDHAVLAVRDDGHWLILDNRWSRLTEDAALKRFAPLFALDEQGVKLFAAPYAALGTPPDGDSFIAGADRL